MRNNQRASALISALFIMTLVAIAATAMSTRLQLDIYRTRLTLNSDKLYLASQAVTGWALAQLSSRDLSGQSTTFPEKLKFIYPGVTTEGRLYDMQAAFNLNNLQDKKYLMLFKTLLENAAENSSIKQQQLIFNATIQWISPYLPERGQDELLNYYLKQKPPYYPAYQQMQNVSEFRSVYGVSTALYQALLPNITALPEVTPININTASKAVLRALGNGLNESQLNELLESRGEKGFVDLKKLTPLLITLNIPIGQITLESSYFLSMATTSIGDSHLTVYTLIKRVKNNKAKVKLSIVNESLNTI